MVPQPAILLEPPVWRKVGFRTPAGGGNERAEVQSRRPLFFLQWASSTSQPAGDLAHGKLENTAAKDRVPAPINAPAVVGGGMEQHIEKYCRNWAAGMGDNVIKDAAQRHKINNNSR